MKGTTVLRMLWRALVLVAVAGALQLVAPPGEAWARYGEVVEGDYDGEGDEGPGTRWRKCRDQAWADYNDCLMDDPYDGWNQAVCYWAWDFDAHACDRELFWDYVGGILPLLDLLK